MSFLRYSINPSTLWFISIQQIVTSNIYIYSMYIYFIYTVLKTHTSMYIATFSLYSSTNCIALSKYTIYAICLMPLPLYHICPYAICLYPARWIWLKFGSFHRSSIKSERRRFSEKSVRPPSCESPKVLVHLLVFDRQFRNQLEGQR